MTRRIRLDMATTSGAATIAIFAAFGLAASAGARTVARVDGLVPGTVQRADVRVLRAVDVDIDGAGAGAGVKALFAYGWLTNAADGQLLWSMATARPSSGEHDSDELVYHLRLRLEPGFYRLYYFAGRSFQAPGPVDLGRLLRPRATSNRGWFIALSVSDADRDAVELAPFQAPPGREVRLAPLGNREFARRRFHVTDKTHVDLHAVGEGYPGKPLVDRSWLMEVTTRKVLWAMESKDATDAGGARKNREQRARIELEPGDYELVAITDDSHSAEAWNDLPPTAPNAWGVTLSAAADAITDAVIPEHPVVRLSGAQDSERSSARFRIHAATPVRLYAFAEWSSGDGALADRAWIEDSRGATVWSMVYDRSSHGGGASKNRVFDEVLEMTPGDYRVFYTTDDSHARNDWNSSEPFEPAAWGITLSVFGDATPFELLDLTVQAGLD